MKIAIIGLGWLGLPLAQKLSVHHSIIGSKRNKTPPESIKNSSINYTPLILPLNVEDIELHNVEFINCAQKPAINALFKDTDCLIITLPASRQKALLEDYERSLNQLIVLAKTFSVKHLIFTSSTSVYGDSSGSYTEQSLCYPTSLPAKVLIKIEKQLIEHFKNKLTIFRLAGLAGPQRHPGKFFQNSPNKIIPIEGRACVNFVHQSDVIDAISLIIDKIDQNFNTLSSSTETSPLAPLSTIYNLCAPIHPSKVEFYKRASATLGLPAPQFILSKNINQNLPWPQFQRIIDGSHITRNTNFRYNYPNPIHFDYNE